MNVVTTQLELIKKTDLKVKSDLHKEVVEILDWFNIFLGYQFVYKQNNLFVKQGNIYEVDLGKNIGSELNKKRPCVIVSSNPFNSGNTIVVVPLKSIKNYSKNGIITVFIDIKGTNLDKKSFISIANIREVSKKRLIKKIGKLKKEDIDKIKQSLSVFLGIEKRTPQGSSS